MSERRAALTALTRKYGDTIDEVLAWAEQGAKRLLDLDGTDERIDELAAPARPRPDQPWARSAARLSDGRTPAAARLGAAVTDELALLAMPHARVAIAVAQHEVAAPQRPAGPVLEVGERWLRAPPTASTRSSSCSPPTPAAEARAAAQGRLGRRAVPGDAGPRGRRWPSTSPVPTFVFDEVDAGVGGKAAVEVGRRLARLARTAQVLVVTHLPQVAAYADRHVVVHKSSDGTVTTSGLTVLDDAGRERELSRMLAGLEDSDTALAHARELLDAAAPARARR